MKWWIADDDDEDNLKYFTGLSINVNKIIDVQTIGNVLLQSALKI